LDTHASVSPLFLHQIEFDMKFPFFAITILITIFCFMMLIKSFDYGKGWAIALAATGLLTFAILSIIALLYQMRKHESMRGEDHH